MHGKRKKFGLRTVIHVLFLGLVILFFCFFWKDSFGLIWQEVIKTPRLILAGALLGGALYCFFDGLALSRLLTGPGKRFPWYQGIFCSFYSSFFRVISFGSGTAAAGLYYAHRRGIPAAESLGGFTIAYAIQRIAIALYFLAGLMINWREMGRQYGAYSDCAVWGGGAACLAVAALILACTSGTLHRLVFSAAKSMVKKNEQLDWLLKREKQAATVRRESLRLLKDRKRLLLVLVFNGLKLSAWYFIPVLLFNGGEKGQAGLLMTAASMVTALAGVIPAPGGVGAVEFVFTLLFTPLTGETRAASGALIYRFATYIFPCIVGAAAAAAAAVRPPERDRLAAGREENEGAGEDTV